MKNTFENICKMSQAKLKKHVAKVLKETHSDITVADGFVFAKGTFPVLLLAHMDTVHKKLPTVIEYDEEKDEISSPNGIGGDDRCGIYMVLEVIKKFHCSVLFCEDEEIGGIGAKKFIQTDLAKELEFNYAIEFDRKGSRDAVFYSCDNEDFEDFITKEFYKTAYGSFSDISVVAPFLKCAAVNLSCGYYNAHTTSEYVKLKEMQKSIEEACKILERTTEADKFEYIEATYTRRWGYGGYYDGYGGYGYDGYGYDGYYYGHGSGYQSSRSKISYYNGFPTEKEESEANEPAEVYYLIEYMDDYGDTRWAEVYACSESDAVGQFCMNHPSIPYANIIDMISDATYGR